MSFVRAPAATAEQNIPPAVCEGEPHAAIEHFSVCEIGLEAVIVFEKIDAPFREGRRVCEFMIITCGVPRAGHRAAAGIHSEFEPFGVYVVGDIFHAVREFRGIGNEISRFVAFAQSPAVVDDDIFVSFVFQARFYHSVGRLQNEFFADVFGEGVPSDSAPGLANV